MSSRSLILAYHSVHPTRNGPLTVRPAAFERQMAWLSKRGFSSVTLESKLEAARNQTGRWPKRVVITFDDGYEDNLRFAEPILRRHGFTATIFLVTSLIGTDDILEPDLSIARYGGDPADYRILSQPQVLKLVERGWNVGAHSVTHQWLTTLDPARVRWEVSESKAVIEGLTGRSVDCFCYPAGRVDAHVVEAVRNAGYRAAVVTPREPGVVETPFTLWRVGVYGHDNLTTFRLKLSRGFEVLRGSPTLWGVGSGFSRLRRHLRRAPAG